MQQRDASLDLARGLIMVLMALDHTRMYFTVAQFDPVSIPETTPAYFLVRWITHLCAPGFFFLAGLGASLAERAGLTPKQSTSWLVTRGAWLILLEFTVIAFAWSFNPAWSWFGVIASLGASMICLGMLRWLPRVLIGIVAGLAIATHNHLPLQHWFSDADLYPLLYGAGVVQTWWGPKVVLFPLVPWLTLMVLGYSLGSWFAPGRRASAVRFAIAGSTCVAAFLVLRAVGIGEPAGGGALDFDTPTRTGMSFANAEKYPPSLQYVLVTLGLLFLCIALFAWLQRKREERARAEIAGPLLVFGRVPFFFYVLHLYLIHALALVTALLLDWPVEYLFWTNVGPNLQPPPGYGLNLGGVYLVVLLVLAILYPACAWFAALRARNPRWWLKYL